MSEKSSKAKKSALMKVFAMVILGGIVAWGILMQFNRVLNNDTSENANDFSKMPLVDQLTGLNLDNAYPGTANGVVELYAKIMMATYNEEYTKQQLDKLLEQNYKLLDKELQENQGSYENYAASMKKEIDSKKKEEITISLYILADESDVKYYTNDDKKMASTDCQFVVRQKAQANTFNYNFVLRQETESGKHWKIVGWQIKEEDDTPELDRLLGMDLSSEYPEKPEKVVELFSRVTKQLYNDTVTDAQFEKLGNLRQALYDEELIANQPGSINDALRQEVYKKKSDGITMAAFVVDDKKDVVYSTVDGRECSKLKCMFSMRSTASRQIVTYSFTLRKDNNNLWKIVGWETFETDEK